MFVFYSFTIVVTSFSNIGIRLVPLRLYLTGSFRRYRRASRNGNGIGARVRAKGAGYGTIVTNRKIYTRAKGGRAGTNNSSTLSGTLAEGTYGGHRTRRTSRGMLHHTRLYQGFYSLETRRRRRRHERSATGNEYVGYGFRHHLDTTRFKRQVTIRRDDHHIKHAQHISGSDQCQTAVTAYTMGTRRRRRTKGHARNVDSERR